MDEIKGDMSRMQQLREKLYARDWKFGAIERLFRFLRTHQPTYEDMAEVVVKHLEFLRYLVCTGRMNE